MRAYRVRILELIARETWLSVRRSSSFALFHIHSMCMLRCYSTGDYLLLSSTRMSGEPVVCDAGAISLAHLSSVIFSGSLVLELFELATSWIFYFNSNEIIASRALVCDNSLLPNVKCLHRDKNVFRTIFIVRNDTHSPEYQ